jgi:tetratricopeptide (TPR) repeat protein
VKIGRIVLAALAISGAGFATYYARMHHDLEYVGSTTHSDGSSTVQTTGAALKHGFNDQRYREGLAFLNRQDFADAEKTFRSIVEGTPDESAALQGLATVLFEQRRYQESMDVFQTILKQDPHFYTAMAGIGAVDRVLGRYPEAAEEYSLALQDNPTFALAYFGRGVSYFNIGKRAEARADLNRVQQLVPPTAELAVEAKAYLAKL